MWILNRLEIALQRADLMFGSIAEDGSLGRVERVRAAAGEQKRERTGAHRVRAELWPVPARKQP